MFWCLRFKQTRLPDYPLSLPVQRLLLIEQYMSQTNSMNSEFQRLFRVTIFNNAKNHSLEVFFHLTLLMMAIVSIILPARKGIWVSIALLWSIKKLWKVFLVLCPSVPPGFPILRGKEVIGYVNASIKSISSPGMTPNACLSSFITDIALGVFLFTFNAKSNFQDRNWF